MFTEFINTLLDILNDVFLPRDVFRAVVAVVIAVIAGMTMKEYKLGKVVNIVLAALAIFGLVLAVRALFQPGFSTIGGWVDYSLNSLLQLQVGVILVYFVAFFLVISVAFGIRSAMK